MRAVAVAALFVSLVAGICFDNGDCLLTPHATCYKTSGGLLGSCIASATATTTTATAPATTTGSICFDDGDCILSGGKCTKASGSITGHCQKSS